MFPPFTFSLTRKITTNSVSFSRSQDVSRRRGELFEKEVVPGGFLFGILETRSEKSESEREGEGSDRYFDRIFLVDSWSSIFRISSEGDLQLFQERVHSRNEGLGSKREGPSERERER